MKKIILSAFTILFALSANSQITSVGETGPNSCDGSAIFDNAASYTSWEWKDDGFNTIQTDGTSMNNLCSGDYSVFTLSPNLDTFYFHIDDVCVSFETVLSTTYTTADGLCDGAASVTETGGTAPYTYNWSNNASITNSASGFCSNGDASNFNGTVTVTDANNCTSSENIIIFVDSSAFPILANTSTNDETSQGACNGTASIFPTGGYPPYTISINSNQYGLCVGTYNFTITDALGTVASFSYTIGTVPTPSTPSISTSNAINGCNGEATLDNPAEFASWTWEDGSGIIQTGGANINSLCQGTYTLNSTDLNGFTNTTTITIGLNCILTTSYSSTFITTQGGCDGTATVTTNGGLAPFTYDWSTGDNTATITNQCTGYMDVLVTDVNGCESQTGGYVSIDSTTLPLVVGVVAYDESTNGACNGQMYTSVTGGQPPYIYTHSNGVTTANQIQMCPGLYEVVVHDDLGNSGTAIYIISGPQNTITNTTYQDSTVNDSLYISIITDCVIDYQNIDSAFVNTVEYPALDSAVINWVVYYNGGIAYYTESYSLDGTGVYTVTITLNCPTKSQHNFMRVIDRIYYDPSYVGSSGYNTLNEKNENIDINLYPIPFNNQLSIDFDKTDTYKISVYDISGQLILSDIFTNTNLISLDLKELTKGQYVVKIENNTTVITRKITK